MGIRFGRQLAACALAAATLLPDGMAAAAERPSPAKPQPAADAVKSGLAVRYYSGEFNHVDEVLRMARTEKFQPGPPLPMLNYKVGDGKVLTHTSTDLVGALIEGVIKFDKPGTYLATFQHNDGPRVWLSGKMIYELPGVTSDAFLPPIEVNVAEPGWYPLAMVYFEKRNTSTLEMYRQPPGTEEVKFVPAENFAHDPAKLPLTN
ncbi:MAG: hypothetical protein EXQ85_03750 [Alphaproteobacteria bacterium]|nr:hypothetical protein [Alphaproteobacteria bacterium]